MRARTAGRLAYAMIYTRTHSSLAVICVRGACVQVRQISRSPVSAFAALVRPMDYAMLEDRQHSTGNTTLPGRQHSLETPISKADSIHWTARIQDAILRGRSHRLDSTDCYVTLQGRQFRFMYHSTSNDCTVARRLTISRLLQPPRMECSRQGCHTAERPDGTQMSITVLKLER